MSDGFPTMPNNMKKTSQFKALLESNELEFLLEAHNGISARIGEEAGFKGLWASGLCLSGQYAVRDNNEASWTQVLEMCEFMADSTSVPIMLDGDTGYGNFNNMRRLVTKLEQRGVAAVCIEDKLFPKQNSFISGETQPLADAEEFAGKIRAGKDAQSDDDFCIVARIEALIAGWGLGEAMRRAEAYVEAGADAILIHSALKRPDEVLAFQAEWGGELPVVIVPTRYYTTPTDVFRDAGFSLAIWANHMLRAAVGAMQKAASRLAQEQNLLSIEDLVVPVSEIFRLQGAGELEVAERRYLPAQRTGTRAVVLAASRGEELGELTEGRPKALVEVDGRPLLQHIVDAYNTIGIKHLTVVRGYAKEAFALPGLHYVDNDEFESTGELVSLRCALDALAALGDDNTDDVVVSYGDLLFRKFVPEILCECESDLALVVDTEWRASASRERRADYVRCTAPPSRRSFYDRVCLERAGSDLDEKDVHGEWMGLFKISSRLLPEVRETLERILADDTNRRAEVPQLMNELVAAGREIEVVYTSGHWLDVNSLADVVRAGSFGRDGVVE
ncbi:MAG: phosphoenolpyruvate mutase [bacterium]|nr:phosphoenolpyruvate mutase [bacterium]